MNSNIIIKKASFDNLKQYSILYNKCFGINLDEKYFIWKFFDNPAGLPIAFEAIDSDTENVAAFYAIMPEYYWVNGTKELFYQSFDTMTHPDYRGQGLFIKLATLTYEEVKRDTGKLSLIGIPGPTSYNGFVKKLEWSCIKKTSYIFLLRHFYLLKEFLRFRKSDKIKVESINNFNDDHNTYFSKTEKHKPIDKLLNSELLNWKIFRNPIVSFHAIHVRMEKEIVGICIYKTDNKGRCFIYYLNTLNETYLLDVCYLMGGYLFKETRANIIYTWEPTYENLFRTFRQLGFLKNNFNKGPFSYKIPVITRFEPMSVNGINMKDINNYDIQPIFQD